MFGFLRSLVGMNERSSVAADRVASALEGLASDLEGVRASVRQRLGLDVPAPVQLPEVITPPTAPPVVQDDANHVIENGTAETPANGKARQRGEKGRFLPAS
jgi:hypothetical protein